MATRVAKSSLFWPSHAQPIGRYGSLAATPKECSTPMGVYCSRRRGSQRKEYNATGLFMQYICKCK